MADKLEVMIGTRVTRRMATVITKMAQAADRPESYIVRKLLEESPAMKARIGRNGNKKKVR